MFNCDHDNNFEGLTLDLKDKTQNAKLYCICMYLLIMKHVTIYEETMKELKKKHSNLLKSNIFQTTDKTNKSKIYEFPNSWEEFKENLEEFKKNIIKSINSKEKIVIPEAIKNYYKFTNAKQGTDPIDLFRAEINTVFSDTSNETKKNLEKKLPLSPNPKQKSIPPNPNNPIFVVFYYTYLIMKNFYSYKLANYDLLTNPILKELTLPQINLKVKKDTISKIQSLLTFYIDCIANINVNIYKQKFFKTHNNI